MRQITGHQAMSIFNSGSSNVLSAIEKSLARVEFDLKGDVSDANSLFLGVVEYTLEEVKGRHHSLFVAPGERESEAYKEFWADLRAGRHQTRDFKRITKSGREVWIQGSYNPILNRRGKVVRIVKFATDITAQKLRSALDAAQIRAINRSQAVIHFTLEGIVTDANANFLTALGYRLDEIKGQHHRLFVGPDERDGAAYAAFWRALANGEYQSGEFKRFAKDGREVWIHGAYNPVLGADGKPYAVVKFATDVTAEVSDRNRRLQGQRAIDRDLGQITQAISDVSQRATTTAEAAAQTSGNVQAVAAGAEEFSSSIEELSRHAVEAKGAADEAVARAGEAGTIISGLTASAEKIGEVIGVIRSIADQTNLLALNATIEAA
uniref:PAS domain-containing protein n=1 Tax=Methylobacterium adhaesivum TaxID=333297 RepID=UPI0024B512D2